MKRILRVRIVNIPSLMESDISNEDRTPVQLNWKEILTPDEC